MAAPQTMRRGKIFFPRVMALVLALALALPQSSRAEVKAKGVCVFDFDDTLKICNENKPECKAPQGGEVIRMCRDNDFAIAIATASCEYNFVRDFLRDQYGFDKDFIHSDCYRHCTGMKQYSLRSIVECQGMNGAWKYKENYKCLALFDDNPGNIQATNFTGSHWIQVNPKTGVQKKDFWKAKDILNKECKKDFAIRDYAFKSVNQGGGGGQQNGKKDWEKKEMNGGDQKKDQQQNGKKDWEKKENGGGGGDQKNDKKNDGEQQQQKSGNKNARRRNLFMVEY